MECDEHAAQVAEGVCRGCMARAFGTKKHIIIIAATAAQLQSHVDHSMYPVRRCATWDCVLVHCGVIAVSLRAVVARANDLGQMA